MATSSISTLLSVTLFLCIVPVAILVFGSIGIGEVGEVECIGCIEER